MLPRLLAHIRGNAIAYVALFVALSGTAVAATSVVLPRGSVGTPQLKRGAVTGAKVKRDTLTGRQIRESRLGKVPLATRADTAGTADSASSALSAQTLDARAASAFLGASAKAVDADRLDGIDSAIFGSVQTYAGMNFEPRDSAATAKDYQSTGAISCSGTPDDLTERVQLPDGASITRVDLRFVDNNAGSNAGLELRAYDTFEQGGLATIVVTTVATSGASAPRRTFSSILPTPHVVDNAHYSYQLNWLPFTCATDTQLVGVAIHYTLPTG